MRCAGSDPDGMADEWEMGNFGGLTTATLTSDAADDSSSEKLSSLHTQTQSQIHHHMKPATPIALALIGLFAAVLVFGQGGLDPTGPPGPTMKRLDEIEARTIVSTANTPGNGTNTFIINAPGSYYLTRNLTGAAGKHGISIRANDVTLDLNGFALISGGGAGLRGIDTPSAITNLAIRNGSARGWAGGGVVATSATALVETLRLSDNPGATGLSVGNGSMVKDCVATGNAIGFYCPDRTQISHCISTVNTGHGFDCTSFVNIIDCTSSRNGGDGFHTLGSCSILRCSATMNLPSGSGILAGGGCTITDCTSNKNGALGISAESGNIKNCTASDNEAVGIYASNGSVANCTARRNGINGIAVPDIFAEDAVVAFCRADIWLAAGSTVTGNR
jgi:parallel beta-helix repeat protein